MAMPSTVAKSNATWIMSKKPYAGSTVTASFAVRSCFAYVVGPITRCTPLPKRSAACSGPAAAVILARSVSSVASLACVPQRETTNPLRNLLGLEDQPLRACGQPECIGSAIAGLWQNSAIR
jgi:hypothetical protein